MENIGRHNEQVRCAVLSCIVSPVLCHSWLAEAPAVMHISQEFYAPMLSTQREWRLIPLADVEDPVATIGHLDFSASWRTLETWEGFLHPEVGALGKYGGGYLWGYFMYGTSCVPSWMFAFLVTIVARRLLYVLTGRRNYLLQHFVLTCINRSKLTPSQPLTTAAYQVVSPENMT